MTAINNRPQISLTPPDQLVSNTGTQRGAIPPVQNTVSSLTQLDGVNFNVNVIPNNYPEVGNNIPANIFPTQTGTAQTASTLPPVSGTAPATTPNTTLKPISMAEAQWAVKYEEKVKKGVQPTAQETAKYQDIVVRFKANPKVDQSIIDILAAQSSSLGAQVASTRYGKDVGMALRGLKGGNSGISELDEAGAVSKASGLRGIGGTLLRGSGLAAIVSGGFSLITNGIMVMQGKKAWSDIGGTVAADTANGALSGLTGTLAAGGASLLVGAGATGLVPGLIIGIGAMGGAWVGDKIFRSTGLYDKIKDTVDGWLQPKPQPNTF